MMILMKDSQEGQSELPYLFCISDTRNRQLEHDSVSTYHMSMCSIQVLAVV